MRKALRSPLFSVVLAAFVFTAILYLCALGFRPDVHTKPPPPDPARLAEVKAGRKLKLHPEHPPRITQEVNYADGPRAAWWPKGESPLLAELVHEGKLPPVAERVGPEPIVMQGVDGIGHYGGTWQRLAASDYDLSHVSCLISYANLVRWSPEGYPIVPHLAKSWEISPDYRVYTFHLRRGMKWSDGVPVTADDIMYWYNDEVKALQLATPEILKRPGSADVAKLEKLDDFTIRFTFSQPWVLFLEKLASYRTIPGVNGSTNYQEYVLPSHFLKKYHPDLGDQELIARKMRELNVPTKRALYIRMKDMTNPEQPRLWPWIARRQSDSSPYVFVRNPYYPAVDLQGNQLPYLDRIVVDVRPQDVFGLLAASGQVSMQDRYIHYDDHVLLMSQAERNDYDVYQWFSGDRSAFTIFPVINRKADPARPDTVWKHRLLNDRRFRQALSLALNRRDIIAALYNGQSTPAQIDPGPDSPYHSEKLFHSYTDYDPARANALLDDLGLTRRDREGFRTFPDGTRMVWYLNMTEATNNDPAQFIVDDWAAVGIRCVPKVTTRFLFLLKKAIREHDFSVWHGESEFIPVIEPRNFAPTGVDAFYAPNYAFWYLFGGMHGSHEAAVSPRAIAPPPDHPLLRNLRTIDQIYRMPDQAERVALFRQMAARNAEDVWTISIGTPPPQLVIVKKGLRNVPRSAVWEGAFESPGNTAPEAYFWEHPNDPPAVVAEIKREMLGPEAAVVTSPAAGKNPPPAAAVTTGSGTLAVTLRWSLLALLAAGAVYVTARHAFIARRLLVAVPTLLVVSIVTFVIVQLPPGDFATTRALELESQGTPDGARALRELRSTFHLDEPMVKQYLRWTGLLWFTSFDPKDKGMLEGDLGRSMEVDRPVRAVVGDRILLTVVVSIATIVLTWVIALPIGIYSAVRQYSAGDYALTVLGFLGMSVPGFLLALVLMYFSHRFFGLAPTGLFSPEFATTPEWSWPKFVDLLKHLWLPTVVLGLGGTAGLIRVMRANLLDELRKPYVVTARAKGASELGLLLKYPVRLALNPFVSGLGHFFPALVSGGAIVAIVLSLPMVGPIMVNALMSEDVYLAGSMLMILSVLSILGTLVSDLVLLWLDPRIRIGSR